MSVVRRGPVAADNFTIVSNAFVRDGRLSLKARGLGLWLLSHRDGWSLSIDTIAKTIGEKDGTTAVKSALSELEDAGYLVRARARDAAGKLGAMEYLISDVSAGETTGGFSTGGSDHGGEIDPHKKTIPQEDHSEEASAAGAAGESPAPPSKAVVYSPEFEAAWKLYGRKGAKRTAWLEWQRAVKRAPVETIAASIPAYVANTPDPRFRKDFERYLKGDVWESAAASPVGAAPERDQAMLAEEADRWLFARFQEADAAAVAARTGREYRAPKAYQLKPGQTADDYLRAHRAAWIKDNRVGLRRVLMGMQFKNGNEVQA